MTIVDARRVFEEDVPLPVVQAIVKALYGVYRESYNQLVLEFDYPERHNLLPMYRRSKAEREMRELAKRYPQIEATAEINSTHNHYHTLLKCGRVLLTQSTAYGPGDMIRYSEYRRLLAQTNQVYFDWSPKYMRPAPEQLTYGVIVHNAEMGIEHKPAFIWVVFPGPDLKSCIARLDLVKMAQRHTDSEGVTVHDNDDLDVRLRPVLVGKKSDA